MLFAEIVQYPVSHVLRRSHRKLRDGHRVEDGTHPLLRLQPQERLAVVQVVDRLFAVRHQITPAVVWAAPPEL